MQRSVPSFNPESDYNSNPSLANILLKYFVNKMINFQSLKRFKSNDDEIKAGMINDGSRVLEMTVKTFLK